MEYDKIDWKEIDLWQRSNTEMIVRVKYREAIVRPKYVTSWLFAKH